MKKIIHLFLIGLILSGCFSKTTENRQTIHPKETDDPISNPYMGWGLWAGPHGFGNTEKDYSLEQNTTGFGDNAPLFKWMMIDWDWASLEPKEGQYNWAGLDSLLSYWSKKNKQFVIRFWFTDDPGWNGAKGYPVCPQWIYEKGLATNTYEGEGKAIHRQPDYKHPSFRNIFLPSIEAFLKEFARKYDYPGTPVIFIQTQGYGHWADNATWYSKYLFPSWQIKHDLLYDIIKIYQNTFKNINLFQFAGPDWDVNETTQSTEEQLYRKGLENILGQNDNFGMIWTGFIDAVGRRDVMETFWHKNPVFAEDNWNYNDLKKLGTKGTLDENLEVVLSWHANFMHFYQDFESYKQCISEDRSIFEKGLKSGGLGYRIVPVLVSYPSEVEAGHIMLFRHSWENRNVGRLYAHRALKIYLTDDNGKAIFTLLERGFNLTRLVKGETYSVVTSFRTKETIPPGKYNVLLSLVDKDEKPDIQLSIEGNDGQNRYKIGTIRITAPK